jgi:hypothetical protein
MFVASNKGADFKNKNSHVCALRFSKFQTTKPFGIWAHQNKGAPPARPFF